MPSRNNRLRNRRAIVGEDVGSDSDAGASSPTPGKSGAKKAAKGTKPPRTSRDGGVLPDASPGRLRRLLALLLLTTILTCGYQVYRLYARAPSQAGSSSAPSFLQSLRFPSLSKAPSPNSDAEANMQETIDRLQASLAKLRGQVDAGAQGEAGGAGLASSPSGASIVSDPNAPGGMVVSFDSPKSSDDKAGAKDEPREDGELRLEDLDYDTLQAAFDALYGDDGPLGPAAQARNKAREKGEGSYRVANAGRKEKLG